MSYFTPFTGRDSELEQLKDLLDSTLDNHGGTVIVKGPNGAGKTRLMSHFLDSINTGSCHILHGRSLKDSNRPLASISGMVEDFLCQRGHSPRWMVRFLPPEIAVHFLPIMPRLGDLYPIEMDDRISENTVPSAAYVFQDFVRQLSWSKPVVILLDDIQWMGKDSLALLRNMACSIRDSAILLIASIRTGSGNSLAETVVDELLTEHCVENIKLNNLSYSEISELVSARFKAPVPEEFCKWLFSMSKGNPLFIEEILKTLLRQNIIHTPQGSNEWKVKGDYRDFTISESLESLVKYRLGHMDDEEIRTLECSAVIGDSFQLDLLRELLRNPSPEAEMRSVNILSSLGMLERSEGSYRFSHPLLRLVLYEGMDKDIRRNLHRNLAAILEKRDGCDAETAMHLTKDLLPEEMTRELALRLHGIASDLRREALDLPASLHLMDQALQIAEISGLEEKHVLRIKAELNYLTWMLGGDALSYEKATSLLEDLLNHDLNREAALMCRVLFHTSLIKRDFQQASKYIKQGIDRLTERDSFYWSFRAEEPLLKRRMGLSEESIIESEKLIEEIPVEKSPEALYRLQTNLAMVNFLLGNVSDAVLHAERARETVIYCHLALRSAESRMNHGLVLMSSGKLDSALDEFRESLKEAMLLNRAPVAGINLLYIGSCFYSRGEYKKAMAHLDEAERKAEEINNPRLRLYTLRYKAIVHLKSGEPHVASDLVKEIEQSPLAGQLEIDLQIIKAQINLRLQDAANAMLCIDKAIELATESRYSTKLGYAVGIRGLVQLELGNLDEALDDLSRSKSLLLTKGEVPLMSDILVEFGLKLDSRQGSDILAKGLELKQLMNATAAIEAIRERLHASNPLHGKILRELDGTLSQEQSRSIEIRTFGGLSLKNRGKQDEGMQRGWAYSKSRELLGLLLLNACSGGITRAQLASILWPDKTEKKAQASLRVSLSHVRRVLGSDSILQDGDYLNLDQDIIRSDFREFNELLSEWDSFIMQGREHAAEDRAVKAIHLYKGVFLPEFYSLPLEDEQFRLQSRMKELLLWMALRCMDRVEYRTALLYARKLLAMDPCSEQACRIVMESLVVNNDWTTAIGQFERLKKSLLTEFGAEPNRKTIALYESILDQHKDTPNPI